jgi:hypothetical protein
MIGVAALWILVLLSAGGFALDRVLVGAITQNFDEGLDYILTSMVASAEIGPDGEVFLNRELGDQRFLEPYSGIYFQISGPGFEPFRSRSLWDRALKERARANDEDLNVIAMSFLMKRSAWPNAVSSCQRPRPSGIFKWRKDATNWMSKLAHSAPPSPGVLPFWRSV